MGEWRGGGLSLNTLSPDRINYSDVSICQRVPAARLGDRDLPPDGERGGGTNGRIRGERGGETGRRKDGGRGLRDEKGGREGVVHSFLFKLFSPPTSFMSSTHPSIIVSPPPSSALCIFSLHHPLQLLSVRTSCPGPTAPPPPAYMRSFWEGTRP